MDRPPSMEWVYLASLVAAWAALIYVLIYR